MAYTKKRSYRRKTVAKRSTYSRRSSYANRKMTNPRKSLYSALRTPYTNTSRGRKLTNTRRRRRTYSRY